MSNLPPGVTDDMIPGNSIADVERDEVIEWVYQQRLTNGEIVQAIKLYCKMYGILIDGEIPQTRY